jgi:hypothetical protein
MKNERLVGSNLVKDKAITLIKLIRISRCVSLSRISDDIDSKHDENYKSSLPIIDGKVFQTLPDVRPPTENGNRGNWNNPPPVGSGVFHAPTAPRDLPRLNSH